mgnify:CR=1 FL=1
MLSVAAVIAGCETPPSSDAPSQAPFTYEEVDRAAAGRVAIGDIDGDGRNDIALHTWTEGIAWYRYPDWERREIVSDIAKGGDEIQLADIDRDGDLDLVGVWETNSDIYWYENPGSSAGAPAASWKITLVGKGGKELKDLSVIDLDGDGRLDTVSRHHDAIKIHFQESPDDWVQRTIDITEREGMAVGDLDSDGDADIVLNGYWLEHPADPRGDPWVRHDIDSLWFEMQGGGWRDNGARVVIADLDADGREDVVLSASERRNEDWPIAWYRQTPAQDGTISWEQSVVGYLPNAHTLQVADFDLDGDLDVLACRLRDSDFLPAYIFYNENGEWRRVQILEGGCYSGKVGDIDDDGDMDFISSRTWADPPVYILRNTRRSPDQTGDLKMKRVQLDVLPERAMFVEPGDIDGDGALDLVAGEAWWRNPGTPEGEWKPTRFGAPLNSAIAVRDFDQDGDLDVLGTQGRGAEANHRFAWAQNDGQGGFEVFTNVDSPGAGDFLQGRAIADFGSGTEVILSWHAGGGGLHALRVPADPANGVWTARKLSPTTQDEDLSAGDIDRDGDTDLLLGTIWLRNEAPGWTAFKIGEVSEGLPDRNSLADIDLDGDLDAVVSLENGREVYWFEAPPDPTAPWAQHSVAVVDGQGFSMDVADMDGDGDTDILVGEHRGREDNRVLLLENRDKGRAWTVLEIDRGSKDIIDHHNGTQAVDIDGDGDPDVVSIGWYNPKLWLYENRS